MTAALLDHTLSGVELDGVLEDLLVSDRVEGDLHPLRPELELLEPANVVRHSRGSSGRENQEAEAGFLLMRKDPIGLRFALVTRVFPCTVGDRL